MEYEEAMEILSGPCEQPSDLAVVMNGLNADRPSVGFYTETTLPKIQGPFKFWNFPLLNFLRQAILGQRVASYSPALKNLETITWTDWKNRERVIEIHREVETI